MPSSAAYAGSRARVVRICESVTDARALRLQLVAEIRQLVNFDAYAWLLTDPGTPVGSAPLADVPCVADSQERQELLSLADRVEVEVDDDVPRIVDRLLTRWARTPAFSRNSASRSNAELQSSRSTMACSM